MIQNTNVILLTVDAVITVVIVLTLVTINAVLSFLVVVAVETVLIVVTKVLGEFSSLHTT